MKDHLHKNHSKNESVQVSNVVSFYQYQCFYCKKTIISKDDLETHKPVCYTIKDFAANPCDICGAQCPSKEDLGRHRITHHAIGTWNEDLGVEIFWCDVCPLTFECKEELEYHIEGCHEVQ